MSAAVAVAAGAISDYHNSSNNDHHKKPPAQRGVHQVPVAPPPMSRYESQKRRDWNTFGQYLKNHRPPLTLSRCSGAHVLEFLRYLDQFGKTKVHADTCAYFGNPHPPAPCTCPLKQAWGSLDALIGRLRAAYEENGGTPEMNPFGARAVRLYLREVRDAQAKARGIAYEKKKKRRKNIQQQQIHNIDGGSLMMDQDQVHDDHMMMNSSSVGGYSGGGFVQLSNSIGMTPGDVALSYFSNLKS